MSLLLLALLAQLQAPSGVHSDAALNNGSGFPDFSCGHSDPLEDGGWGTGSKYCILQVDETPGYTGYHGDLTLASLEHRYYGWAFMITNAPPEGGSNDTIFTVHWGGDVQAKGSFHAGQNGGGIRNLLAYAGVYGNSQSAAIPDVVVAPIVPHLDHRPILGVHNGTYYAATFFADGFVQLFGATFRPYQTGDALVLEVMQEDGGTRTATLPYNP